MRLVYIFFTGLILFSSCGPARNLVYFSDLEGTEQFKTTSGQDLEPRIQPHDLLSITVSSLHPESNVLFNSGMLQVAGTTSSVATSSSAMNRLNEGYQVDAKGAINFPVLGKVTIAGLTREEATEKLAAEINRHVKNPIVNIRFQNFKVTVIGEVNKPATFTVPTERINILEALGLAGDLTVYGKRENILIVREQDGGRSTTRINLNHKDLLSSPYFYLQQNDIIYVEPVRSKAAQASMARNNIALGLSAFSIIAIIFTQLR